MKADHRHELKTNELADWLAHLPDWLKDNRNTLIGAAAVIVVAVVVYFWIFYQNNVAAARTRVRLTNLVTQVPAQRGNMARALSQQTDQSYLMLDIARNLEDFAQNTRNDNMGALALIERAEAIRTEIHYQRGDLTREELAKRVADAQGSYQQALERSPNNPALAATAQFGLGLCEEELGNFDKAGAIYQEVAAKEAYEGTAAKAAAAFRLQTIDDYRGAVAFKPAPLTPPTPPRGASLPQIQLRPGDTNAPVVVPAPQGGNVGPAAPVGPAPAPQTGGSPTEVEIVPTPEANAPVGG